MNFSVSNLNAPDSDLASVLDSLFDGVYIVDNDRRIIFWNRGAEAITGYAAAEVRGRCCSEDILNHIDENGKLLCGSECPLASCLRTGEEIAAKVYALHKSGRRFPVRTHIAPLRDDSGAIVAGIEVFRDISDEEEFRQLQEKINRLVQQYVSKSTYEEILQRAGSGTGNGTRPRDLTIFFLDVAGFTPFSETHAPEEVVRMLNNVFGICDVITRESHGDIDKFIGDAIMAVFVDANDAVSAAERILDHALPHYNRVRESEGLEPVRVRIGINSGRVLQGNIGTEDRKDLTVIGDVVNCAQRIESAAEPGVLLLSEATYSRLRPERSANYRLRGEVAVKGKSRPVRVYVRRTD